jgi:hypothetical protein
LDLGLTVANFLLIFFVSSYTLYLCGDIHDYSEEKKIKLKAADGIRTHELLITNQPL